MRLTICGEQILRIINLNNLKHFKGEDMKIARDEVLYSIFIIGTLLCAATLFLGAMGLLIYMVMR